MFFITLLIIVFADLDHINFSIMIFLFVIKTIFVAIDPLITLSLKIVSCYFNFLKFLVILTSIFNHTHITLSVVFLIFIRWHQQLIIVRLLFFLLVIILVIMDKLNLTSVYDIILNSLVQAIRKFHCAFSYGHLA